MKFGEAAVTQEEIHLGIVGANAKKLLGKRLKPSVQIADARLNLATGVPYWRILDLGIFADISDKNDFVYAFWHFL